MNTHQLRTSKEIQKRTGKTFHLATRFLPKRVRHGTYVLYAFSRVADDVVDEPGDRTPADQRAAFDRIRGAVLDGEPTDDAVLSAFRTLREEYDIERADVEAFLASMERDVSKRRYATYEELDAYMHGSAASVGTMMTAIMRVDDPERARPHAAALGKAFQLTNFLRDVREDVEEHGRIYLPGTTRERFGVTAAQLESLRFDEGFERVVRRELVRAEALYREGVAGIRYLPADCRFPVLLAAVLYADYHRAIRARGHDVLSARPRLGLRRKLFLLARLRWRWARDRHPERAFYAVSAVPERPGADADPVDGTLSALKRKATACRPIAVLDRDRGD